MPHPLPPQLFIDDVHVAAVVTGGQDRTEVFRRHVAAGIARPLLEVRADGNKGLQPLRIHRYAAPDIRNRSRQLCFLNRQVLMPLHYTCVKTDATYRIEMSTCLKMFCKPE